VKLTTGEMGVDKTIDIATPVENPTVNSEVAVGGAIADGRATK
jgi:hypothetical protein